MQALGMIEVIGYTTAIEAADAALKSADIKLWQISKVGGGIVTVMFYGDVSAVESAAENGGMAAEKIGKVRSVHVIARADSALKKMIPAVGGGEDEESANEDAENKQEINAGTQKLKNISGDMSNGDVKNYSIDLHADTMPSVTYTEPRVLVANVPTQDELMNKSNTELKNMARELGISASTVKYARKNDLVQMIIGGMNNA